MTIRVKYSRRVANAVKDRKYKEALLRQDNRDKRTAEEQLAKLDKGNHVAIKERTRLERRSKRT